MDALLTRNEDVTSYIIGSFGDKRLCKTGALLFKRITTELTTSIKKLARTRALQVAFTRFLSNKRTSALEIEESYVVNTNKNCLNKAHILCVQDTVEINYSSQSNKKSSLGINRTRKAATSANVHGFLAHPCLVIDANNNDILGLSSLKLWSRGSEELINKKLRAIEDKESFKWLEGALSSKQRLSNASMITYVSDRESDIYEYYDRIPDANNHLLIRAMHDRKLTSNIRLSEHMNLIKPCGSYQLELPSKTGVRRAHLAQIDIKYSTVEITAPQQSSKSEIHNRKIQLTCVEAIETNETNQSSEKIHWRLLTTHQVDSFDTAREIIKWYTSRWNIEQVFRTMKKRGLKIDESQVENPESLFKLFALAIGAAVKVLTLVNARDDSTNQHTSDIFTEDEIAVLKAISQKVNGSTKRQQNPYQTGKLSWAAWIIARLGGWNGYVREKPPGPITMYDGLEAFYKYVQGFMLAKDVCIP